MRSECPAGQGEGAGTGTSRRAATAACAVFAQLTHASEVPFICVRSEIDITVGLRHHLMAFYFCSSVERGRARIPPTRRHVRRGVGSSCLGVRGHLCQKLPGLGALLQSEHPRMVFKVIKVLGPELSSLRIALQSSVSSPGH